MVQSSQLPSQEVGLSFHLHLRTVRRCHNLIAKSILVALFGCTAQQDIVPDSHGALAPPFQSPAKVADPMANFARLIPGEWRQTASNGTSMFHTWHWGPGQHSIRRRTDGVGAGGEPWHELQVYYWHDGLKQIRVLGMSPYARGINEGTIQFDGETAEGISDLYQSGGIHRQMGLRWVFSAKDRYRETLLEATDPGDLKPLVEFDQIRTKPAAVPRPHAVEGEKPSEHLKAFEPLLGHVWEARGAWTAGGAIHTRTTFEWVPVADAIYARVIAPTTDGEPTHLLDAYLYHHTGTKTLRCLALSNSGGVHEGEMTMREGEGLQFDLKGYENNRAVQLIVCFDFDTAGTLRDRVWSLKGAERTLLLDIQHKKLDP